MKGVMSLLRFLLPLWSILGEIFDFQEISENKNKLKTALEQLREKFGGIKITTENISKFVEVAELTKEMGGLDALHETLTEAKASGMLDDLTRLFDEDTQVTWTFGSERQQVEEIIPPTNLVVFPKNENQNDAKRTRILEVASAEIGYSESPPNSNRTKYGEWFGWNGVAWCGIFVSWVFAMARLQLPNIGFPKGFAGCMTAVDYFRKNGEITQTPKPGDLVFFDWNKDGRWDHVGIFVRWIDGPQDVFETIEGNTSAGNQSNGGQVQRRERSRRATYSVLFVSPNVLS